MAVRDVLTQEVHLNPDAEFTVKPSDALVVLGRYQDLALLKQA